MFQVVTLGKNKPKPKITFWGLEEWEEDFLRKHLSSQFKIHFRSEHLREGNIDNDYDADYIGVFIHSDCSSAVLSKFKNLKFICTFSTGYNHIDLEYCKKKKIGVAYVPSYGTKTVAEATFALLLSLVRKIPSAYERVLHGNFSPEGLCGIELYGKTLGVIGTGHIGTHVIEIAKGFGMNVIAYDPYPKYAMANKIGFSYATLNQVLKNCDILTLHVPLMPKTRHMINRKRISLMKKGAIIINTSRGSVIDTKALAKAIIGGRLSGAALDVIEEEPLVRDEKEVLTSRDLRASSLRTALLNHILIGLPNVIVTPHTAFYTHQALLNIVNTCVENFRAFRAGKLLNRLDAKKQKKKK